jgi:hypothetical protein
MMDDQDPLIDRLRGLGRHPVDPATAARHLGAMASTGGHTARAVKFKVGAALFAGLVLGGTGFATAGAPPRPAQDAAHSALSKVGLEVPKGHGPARYNGPECGTDPQTHQPFANHGQYVRSHQADPNAGSSRCGKPIQAGSETTNATEAPDSNEKPDSNEAGPGSAYGNRGHGKHDHPTDSTAPSTTQLHPQASLTTTHKPLTAPASPTAGRGDNHLDTDTDIDISIDNDAGVHHQFDLVHDRRVKVGARRDRR